MARRTSGPAVQTASARVSGNSQAALAASAAVFKQGRRTNPKTTRNTIAKDWQVEAYRHANICGEARYAAMLFAATAGRAEIGISEPQTLAGKPKWVNQGEEVEALAEIAPTVRERSRLIREYMLHRIIAGECYLIARDRVDTDPGYVEPPVDPETGKPYRDWDTYLATQVRSQDLLDRERTEVKTNPNRENPLWEVVAVTELRRIGDGEGERWSVRHDNGTWLELRADDPVIRMWTPDPENRREAWSPFRSMLPTLREIEFFTYHIFTQVRSRLISAGVWFMPENLTFPAPTPDMVEGGAEALAQMNEAEQFMAVLTHSAMEQLEPDEVSFPTIVMADPAALEQVDQNKLIKFWSEMDDKATNMRSDAVRRFALGMDLPPEQVLGSSGLAVTGAGGSAGSVNHWGVWANEEQTISVHVEPALDDFTGTLTAVIHVVVENSTKVVGYNTASMRLRQDRSKESIELYDRGELKATVMLRENGFDPENDLMDDPEFKRWLLKRMVSGSPDPNMMYLAANLLGVELPYPPPAVSGNPEEDGRGLSGPAQPPALEDHPHQGPPREQHDHSPAPFNALTASCEGLVLRALEKAGNRVLNDGKRGKDRDRSTPPHLAHVASAVAPTPYGAEFDFSTAGIVFDGIPAARVTEIAAELRQFCVDLYAGQQPYTRQALIERLAAL